MSGGSGVSGSEDGSSVGGSVVSVASVVTTIRYCFVV